jgi:cell division protease FtsH
LARALLQDETLDEQEILDVTGLPQAPHLETLPIPAGRDGAATGSAPVPSRSDGRGLANGPSP